MHEFESGDVITPKNVVAGLNRVVYSSGEDKGDFVYEKIDNGCVNWIKDGEEFAPSCIIGHLVHLWFGQDGLKAMLPGSPASYLDTILREEFDVAVEADAIRVMTMAQVLQDQGVTWGAALSGAEHVSWALRDARQEERLKSE